MDVVDVVVVGLGPDRLDVLVEVLVVAGAAAVLAARATATAFVGRGMTGRIDHRPGVALGVQEPVHAPRVGGLAGDRVELGEHAEVRGVEAGTDVV